MNEILIGILRLSLSGSFFILVLYLCKPILLHRFSKSWQYYIWLIVITRLLTPFSLEINILNNVFERIESIFTTLPSQQETLVKALPDIKTQKNITDGAFSEVENTNNQVDSSIVAKVQTTSFTQQFSWKVLISNAWLVWIIVVVILLIRKITIYQSFIHYIRIGRVEVSDIEHLELLGKITEQQKIKCNIELYTNSLVSSPMLIGFFKPYIILPTIDLSDVDFKDIILHELTHYKRYDMFYKWIVQITICLHWFNPIVYFMGHEINRACELSCDEAVISKLNTNEQKAYGDTLLNAIVMDNYNQPIASLSLNESKKFIKERLDAIMNFKKKSLPIRCAMFIFTLVFICGFAVTGTFASNGNFENTNNKQEAVAKTNMETIIIGNIVFYLVETEQQLRSIGNNEDMLSLNYMQNSDIILKDKWTPIGTNEKPFTGTFNGNGFEIINLKIVNEESNSIGLFGFAQNAQINNVTLNNANIENDEGSKKTVIAICTWANNCKIYDNRLIESNGEEKKIDSVEESNLSLNTENLGNIISTNSKEKIKTSEVEQFTMELIQTTACWDTVEPFLPYITSSGVEKMVTYVQTNNNIEKLGNYKQALNDAKKYFGKGTKTYTNTSLTRGDIDEHAINIIYNTTNWSYVKPLFPYMTQSGVEEVVSIFVQKTGNYDKAKEAKEYIIFPINQNQTNNRKTNQQSNKTGNINFQMLPYMKPDEVDNLAIDYINQTGEFYYVYNLRQFMTTKGIDEAVFLYISKTKDYKLVTAMLQFMSKEASRSLTTQYHKDSVDNEADWVYESYK